MWTTLNFRGRGKTIKTARDIYMRTLYIEFERDRSIGLGSTFGDDHTDRDTHTHTQTFFLKHIFDSGSDVKWKNHKKSKSKILTIAILPSLLMSLESKKGDRKYLQGDSRYRISTRLVSWFWRYVTWQTKLKTIFLVSRIFSGKADSIILLGFECTINPQNLIKIVGAIFEKIKIKFFFLCELPLILGLGWKLKKGVRDICEGTLDFEFERDWWVYFGPALWEGKKF